MSKFDPWGVEDATGAADSWDDELFNIVGDGKRLDMRPRCGGVRFDHEESKSSFDWGFVISTFFVVGIIAIVGHLINLLLN